MAAFHKDLSVALCDGVQASGERLRSSRLFLSFVKQHLFVTLVRSVVVPSLCLVSLDIFLFIVQHHYVRPSIAEWWEILVLRKETQVVAIFVETRHSVLFDS